MLGLKIIIIFFGICVFYDIANTQTDEVILQYAERMPQFPGGPDSLYTFVGRNIRYPAAARENNISGTVVLKFYIDKEGYLRDPSVAKSVSPLLDAEAMRVVSLMNEQGYRWTPGMHEGKIASVYFALPIKFILQGIEGKKKKKGHN